MLYVLVFLALIVVPVRFFYLNSYFLNMKLGEALAIYQAKPGEQKMVDSFLGLLFVIGMAALAAVAT
ncbi:MAG: hypothetical protein EA370_00375 [Wenzhouxiangella sp.]|nr:MAG: hypothetical protein EA370_00375 [Wenzhouxiangella sp.]